MLVNRSTLERIDRGRARAAAVSGHRADCRALSFDGVFPRNDPSITAPSAWHRARGPFDGAGDRAGGPLNGPRAGHGGIAPGKPRTYGMMYGMLKTTVYLPQELKRALAELAVRRGQSEADLVREALAALTASEGPPAPRLPLFRSGKPSLAEQVDERLTGFGRR